MPKGKIVPLLADSGLMRHVREVLRLKFVGGVSIREIARRNGVAASTVRATIKCFQAADLSWPLPEEMTDAAHISGISVTATAAVNTNSYSHE